MATCPPFKGDANCVINKNTEFVNRDATGKEIFGMPKGVFDTKNMDNLVKCGVACANNVGFALGEAKVMENVRLGSFYPCPKPLTHASG